MKKDKAYAQGYINKGLEFSNKGEYKRSLKAYKKAKLFDPTNVWAWSNTGFAYFRLRNLKKAFENYITAVKIDPQNSQAWINLAVAYKTDAQFDEALKAYEKAREITPKNKWCWYGAGLMYYYLGDKEKAIFYLEKATKLSFDDKKIRESLQIVKGERDIRSTTPNMINLTINSSSLKKMKHLLEKNKIDECLYCGISMEVKENQEFICAQKIKKLIWEINGKIPISAYSGYKFKAPHLETEYRKGLLDPVGEIYKVQKMVTTKGYRKVKKFNPDFFTSLKGSLCKKCSIKFIQEFQQILDNFKIIDKAEVIEQSIEEIFKNYFKLFNKWIDMASNRLNL